ncbi:MAG TPA: DNA-processing protein DprA [Candidatus Aminicenantes bacterium]|nr:DNA-processing protein DprA [Candidatus Aminicenantes bacterium]
MGPIPDEILGRIGAHLLLCGNSRADRALRRLESRSQSILTASPSTLARLGFDQDEIQRITRGAWRDEAASEWEQATRAGIRLLFPEEEGYPPLLGEIADPPRCLYCLGRTEALALPDKLAVVGARQASPYGISAVRTLVPTLAQAGLVVVSGMAHGIDATAHRETLSAGGVTIGVNAGGLFNLYPAAQRSLIDRIVKTGAVISEFPLATVPRPHLFPIRNRIISGLCRAVLVVEAARRSGSLITAKLALEQDRDVLAVPGPIGAPLSEGPHYLIAHGAKLIERPVDVLTEYGRQPPASIPERSDLTASERKVLDLLCTDRVKRIDDLVDELDLSTAETVCVVMGLVLKNLAFEDAGGYRRIGSG